mmetsp:Transcript_161/g.625  ORF Transcript_161/g.625 Transcript_161/m.625 type:complete len:545 (-) Transcript_161:141-1775(-)
MEFSSVLSKGLMLAAIIAFAMAAEVQSTGEASDFSDAEMSEALEEDSACSAQNSSCALNALQLRGTGRAPPPAAGNQSMEAGWCFCIPNPLDPIGAAKCVFNTATQCMFSSILDHFSFGTPGFSEWLNSQGIVQKMLGSAPQLLDAFRIFTSPAGLSSAGPHSAGNMMSFLKVFFPGDYFKKQGEVLNSQTDIHATLTDFIKNQSLLQMNQDISANSTHRRLLLQQMNAMLPDGVDLPADFLETLTQPQSNKLPLVVLPGTMSTCAQMGDLLCIALKALSIDCACNSYTQVPALLPFELIASVFYDMRSGLAALHKWLKADPKYANGFILLAFSQGNFVARSYLQLYNDPPAKAYISIDGPLAGEFFPMPGGAECCAFIPMMPNLVQWCHYVYSPTSRQITKYSPFAKNILLNQINAQTAAESHLLRTERMVMTAGYADPVIQPMCSPMNKESGSAHFGPMSTGMPPRPLTLKQTQWYKNNMFGIRTMCDSGRMSFIEHPGTHCMPGPFFPFAILYLLSTYGFGTKSHVPWAATGFLGLQECNA